MNTHNQKRVALAEQKAAEILDVITKYPISRDRVVILRNCLLAWANHNFDYPADPGTWDK